MWLRRYIYERCYSTAELKTDKRKAERAQMLTMVASAVWHGIYPGYYLTFIQLSVLVTFCKKVFALSQSYPKLFAGLNNLKNPALRLMYAATKSFWVMMIVCYVEVQFYGLSLANAIVYQQNFSWTLPAYVVGCYLFSAYVKMPSRKKLEES